MHSHSALILWFACLALHGVASFGQVSAEIDPESSVRVDFEFEKTATPATIDFDQRFIVKISNTSQAPIRLWKPESRHGYALLSLEFEYPPNGQIFVAQRTVILEGDSYFAAQTADEEETPTEVIELAPGASVQYVIDLNGFVWGHRAWNGLPPPNLKEAYQVTAHFLSPKTPLAAAKEIWTGSRSSTPLTAHFVAPKLTTPHELIVHGMPDAALAMMKLDKKWISKRDSMQCTPLHHAAQGGYAAVVTWLVENGADVSANAYNNFTPLYFADQVDVVRALLKGSPRIALETGDDPPLHRVAEQFSQARDGESRKRWSEIADLLRKAGAKDDLIVAIYLDDLPLAKRILEKSPEAAMSHQYPSPLRLATRLGRFAICRELIEIPEVDINDLDGGSGLPIAIDAVAFPEIMKLLINNKADLASRISYQGVIAGPRFIDDNATLLHYAAAHGSPETITLLIDHGVDLFAEASDTYGVTVRPQTALDLAAMQGHYENVLAMIRHATFARSSPSFRQVRLDRCLVLGAGSFGENSGDLANFYEGMIEAGANPNAKVDNQTALKAATNHLDPVRPQRNEQILKAIKVLEHAGVEVDLATAVMLGDEARVAQLLKQTKTGSRFLSADGVPALHLAVKMNHIKIISQLLAAGCEVDIRNQSEEQGSPGETALFGAAFWGRFEAAKMLIQYGAEVNAIDRHGRTSLFDAARMKHLKIARLLLKSGAKLDVKDVEGETPLQFAGGDREVANLFEEFATKRHKDKAAR